MTHIIQKTWTSTKEITILADGLFIKTKNVGDELEFKVKFEELGFGIVKQRNKAANIPFYCFILFDLLYIYILISSIVNNDPIAEKMIWICGLFLFAALTLGSYRDRNKDAIYLTGGRKNLELLATKPDAETVHLFIEIIHKSMRTYYKNRYTAFAPETPYEVKINQIKWLKDIDAITEHEYRELLDTMRIAKIIGFQPPFREN